MSLNKAKKKHKGIDEGDNSLEFTETNTMAISSRTSRLKVNQVDYPSKTLKTSTDKPKATSPRTQLSSRRETIKANASAIVPFKVPAPLLTKKASESKKFNLKPENLKPEPNRSSKLKPTVARTSAGKNSSSLIEDDLPFGKYEDDAFEIEKIKRSGHMA